MLVGRFEQLILWKDHNSFGILSFIDPSYQLGWLSFCLKRHWKERFVAELWPWFEKPFIAKAWLHWLHVERLVGPGHWLVESPLGVRCLTALWGPFVLSLTVNFFYERQWFFFDFLTSVTHPFWQRVLICWSKRSISQSSFQIILDRYSFELLVWTQHKIPTWFRASWQLEPACPTFIF